MHSLLGEGENGRERRERGWGVEGRITCLLSLQFGKSASVITNVRKYLQDILQALDAIFD
jgi:hypothetical protein